MDFLNWLFQNKLVEMVVSGLVGWLIARILDPPDKPSNRQVFIADEMTVTQVNVHVQQQINYRQPGRARSIDEERETYQLFLMATGAVAIGVLVAMVVYGTLVVDVVRFLVTATGFAAIFLGMRISGSNAFQTHSWLSRLVGIAAVCAMLWFALDYVEDGIVATIISAQRRGYQIQTLPDMLNLFGLQGVLQLGHLAIAVVIAVFVSLVALTVQGHMLLSAHAATAFNPRDWRVKLLALIGNRSKPSIFVVMVVMSAMALTVASGFWLRMFAIR